MMPKERSRDFKRLKEAMFGRITVRFFHFCLVIECHRYVNAFFETTNFERKLNSRPNF